MDSRILNIMAITLTLIEFEIGKRLAALDIGGRRFMEIGFKERYISFVRLLQTVTNSYTVQTDHNYVITH